MILLKLKSLVCLWSPGINSLVVLLVPVLQHTSSTCFPATITWKFVMIPIGYTGIWDQGIAIDSKSHSKMSELSRAWWLCFVLLMYFLCFVVPSLALVLCPIGISHYGTEEKPSFGQTLDECKNGGHGCLWDSLMTMVLQVWHHSGLGLSCSLSVFIHLGWGVVASLVVWWLLLTGHHCKVPSRQALAIQWHPASDPKSGPLFEMNKYIAR